MIAAQLILFCAALILGAVSRIVYVLVCKLEKSIALRPITIILDSLTAGVVIAAFVFLQFVLNQGVFAPFALIATIMGFVLASLVV